MRNFFLAFSSRPFTFLWLSEIFTQISVNVFNFILVLMVFNLTSSNTAVAGIVLSFTIPAILFGVLGGVYVDHHNKKTILIMTNLIRGVLLLILAFFHSNLAIIFLISVLISLATQFFIPAETPMIPLIVEKRQLLSANALFGLGIYGSILLAYVLSGPMIIALGESNTLVLLAVLLFIGTGFISLIKLPKEELKDHNRKNLKHVIYAEIKHALAITSATREIHNSLFLLALSQIMILIIAVIAPGYAEQVLGIQVEEFPLLFVAPAAFGVIAGAVLVTSFEKLSKDKIITIGLFLSGIAMFILPYGSKIASREIVQTLNTFLPSFLRLTTVDVIVSIAFVLGLANALVFVPSNTILQEKTSEELRGKIYGVLNTIVGTFSLLPIIIVGGLSDLIGVTRVIVGIGISLLLVGLGRVFLKL